MPFKKGNPGGPGRPTLTTEQKRVKALTARLKSGLQTAIKAEQAY